MGTVQKVLDVNLFVSRSSATFCLFASSSVSISIQMSGSAVAGNESHISAPNCVVLSDPLGLQFSKHLGGQNFLRWENFLGFVC